MGSTQIGSLLSFGLRWADAVHVPLGSPAWTHPIGPSLEGMAGSGQVAQECPARCPKSAGVIFVTTPVSHNFNLKEPPC